MAILWHSGMLGTYIARRTRYALPFYHPRTLPHDRKLPPYLLHPVRLCSILLIVTFSSVTLFLLFHARSLAAVFIGHRWRLQELFIPAPWSIVPLIEPPSPHPVRLATTDTVYDAFLAPSAAQAVADARIRPIRAHDAIPYDCLDNWVATGRWEASCLHGMVHESQIDLVYVWVNGSDALHSQSRAELLARLGYETKNARFREHDELRYSLRAARQATKGWPHSAWHLVTADVKTPNETRLDSMSHYERAAVSIARDDEMGIVGNGEESREKRLGLVPQWLDIDCAFNASRSQVRNNGNSEHPPIILHHDTQLFRYSNDPEVPVEPEHIANWLAKVMPSFNSHAIESQLANLPPDIVADQIVAMNDDQFLTLPTPPSAFHTTLYGSVLRMDPELLVGGDNTGAGDGGGEWRSIPWSAHLLDERFGKRKRPYMKHISRSLSLPLLHEALLAFGKPFAATPLSQFRGSHFASREWEVNTIFLASHFVIERHREALLWSWVVGKWGGVIGVLDAETKFKMWVEMGGESMGKTMLNLKEAKRTTLADVERNLRRAGVKPPRGKGQMDTNYYWVSMDGYSASWMNLAERIHITPACLGNHTEAAWAMFRRLVMNDLACGDQIISSLMYSTRSGLGIFLPPTPSFPVASDEPITLPLVLPTTRPFFPSNPRAFAVRLIQRYAYVLGHSPAYFIGPKNSQQMDAQLRTADKLRYAGLLCINDDLGDDESDITRAEAVLKAWFAMRWPERLECEIG
ncbi:hypothetical protein MIND_01402700 [Mycena indigotica]|uniref:Stealth protein CR3 conserved region 3 domain-containing protein n=1 Tax=Mycena indigotica TaxID=2126181 RepID=A0A8H6VPH9_9AGAR|nr:uncharacterized protein MIND_01402700 [Mycena indigotica]KAF7288869.1 hypothetical protein MIND_01402700 [Mycena indigotica]